MQYSYANVILPLPLAGLFSYRVPFDLVGACVPGVRVAVPFGKKKIYSAIVRSVTDTAPDVELKNIVDVLDRQPVVSEQMFQFWEWVAQYYMCELGEVMQAALPAGLKLQSETEWQEVDGFVETAKLSPNEHNALLVLSVNKKMQTADLAKAVGSKNILPLLNKLIEKGAIIAHEKLSESYKPKTKTYLKLHSSITSEKEVNHTIESLKRAPKQQEILSVFLQLASGNSETGDAEAILKAEIDKQELLGFAKISDGPLNELIKKDIICKVRKRIERIQHNDQNDVTFKELSPEQAIAFEQIKELHTKKQTVLLHGVTSSGKTELYMQLIKQYLETGKQVLYLLPEIALTTQIITRLKKAFGNTVGVYHSKFSDSERVEIWNRATTAKTGEMHQFENEKPVEEYKLILGTRSSIFMPFGNLGLIIADEEHDGSYKQYDPAPRYNARDAAVYLAVLHGAKVLLGTATPSVESYYNVKTGKYGLVELFTRFSNIEMPQIEVIDIRKARKQRRMNSHFSHQLLKSIDQSVQNNEQVILFQNRRGYSPFIECNDCGHVPNCEHCDVSLTYHKFTNKLICHYCGFSYNLQGNCMACNSTKLSTKGFGTEKIEDEIGLIYPDYKTLRMDVDTTRSKTAYNRIISDFENRKAQILIGTQMVSKGLDFDNVSTVGILNADNMLNFPDFRANERSYQLMTQVSGRAGRKNKQGKVLIQTSQPEHHVIRQVVNGNYIGLFNNEIQQRRLFKYPPYYRIVVLTIKHRDRLLTDKAADSLAVLLRVWFGEGVLGPEYPPVGRMQNKYRKNIMLKMHRKANTVAAKDRIQQAISELKVVQLFKYVQISLDVDPV